jgi:hypothetical protein
MVLETTLPVVAAALPRCLRVFIDGFKAGFSLSR